MSLDRSLPSNRRQHRRARAKSLAAHLETEAGPIAGHVEDLSLGGIFLRTDRRLPIATPVTVNLVRPGMKRALRVPGLVANSRTMAEAQSSEGPPGLGIAFGALDPLETARLVELIRAFAAPGMLPTAREEPAPAPIIRPAPPEANAGEAPRLMMQVRGLLLELEEARRRLDEQSAELGALREHQSRLERDLGERDALLARLRALLASDTG